jgi:hypothetical protein
MLKKQTIKVQQIGVARGLDGTEYILIAMPNGLIVPAVYRPASK